MKCEKCGVELSDKVWRIHQPLCMAKKELKPVKSDMTKPEVIEALRKKNVKFNPRHKVAVLEALLNIEEKFISPEEV